MCGIVGLLVRRAERRASLGEYVMPMFRCMSDRGPDSAGLAVFMEPLEGAARRFNLYSPHRDYNWPELREALARQTTASCEIHAIENHATLRSSIDPQALRGWLPKYDPSLHLLSVGRSIDVYKDTGNPMEIARRYGFAGLSASHCVGHTRMATESAVTPAHSHPFTAGEDFCLVHNGSLSNPYSLRRRLEKQGISFETDNDTEAACRFLEWRMRSGDDLRTAIHAGFDALDGFYTLLMATPREMLLVRDAFSCKPAVVAEHDDYVAVSSEFRSLAHLPDIANARLFEPQPEEIHEWKVQ
jgi:glutamate synthase domain-containing protein 1